MITLKFFKYLAIIEGYSFLFILFLTMPLKYIWEIMLPNKLMGMAHGILFIAYVAVAVYISKQYQWNNKKLSIILLMSIIPFGTFWMEKKYLKEDISKQV